MSRHYLTGKMRISFDLDEVLFVSPETHKTEKPLRFPFNKIYKEKLRLGTPELINKLQKLGYEVWVYTSSFRTEKYIEKRDKQRRTYYNQYTGHEMGDTSNYTICFDTSRISISACADIVEMLLKREN